MIDHESSPADAALEAVSSSLDEAFETRPIGEYLRRQRLLRGISTEELSSITRIPLRSLERLESGQFDGDTDGFVRGFVRTVANALGLDADDAIARMLREPAPGNWEGHIPNRGLKQALVGLVLLAMLATLGLVLRAGWNAMVGVTSTPGSRDVVVWHDPVRALAEATGVALDPAKEFEPGDEIDEIDAVALGSAAPEP